MCSINGTLKSKYNQNNNISFVNSFETTDIKTNNIFRPSLISQSVQNQNNPNIIKFEQDSSFFKFKDLTNDITDNKNFINDDDNNNRTDIKNYFINTETNQEEYTQKSTSLINQLKTENAKLEALLRNDNLKIQEQENYIEILKQTIENDIIKNGKKLEFNKINEKLGLSPTDFLVKYNELISENEKLKKNLLLQQVVSTNMKKELEELRNNENIKSKNDKNMLNKKYDGLNNKLELNTDDFIAQKELLIKEKNDIIMKLTKMEIENKNLIQIIEKQKIENNAMENLLQEKDMQLAQYSYIKNNNGYMFNANNIKEVNSKSSELFKENKSLINEISNLKNQNNELLLKYNNLKNEKNNINILKFNEFSRNKNTIDNNNENKFVKDNYIKQIIKLNEVIQSKDNQLNIMQNSEKRLISIIENSYKSLIEYFKQIPLSDKSINKNNNYCCNEIITKVFKEYIKPFCGNDNNTLDNNLYYLNNDRLLFLYNKIKKISDLINVLPIIIKFLFNNAIIKQKNKENNEQKSKFKLNNVPKKIDEKDKYKTINVDSNKNHKTTNSKIDKTRNFSHNKLNSSNKKIVNLKRTNTKEKINNNLNKDNDKNQENKINLDISNYLLKNNQIDNKQKTFYSSIENNSSNNYSSSRSYLTSVNFMKSNHNKSRLDSNKSSVYSTISDLSRNIQNNDTTIITPFKYIPKNQPVSQRNSESCLLYKISNEKNYKDIFQKNNLASAHQRIGSSRSFYEKEIPKSMKGSYKNINL